jgi:V8-like Glu-specific endopeptidase
MFDTGRGRKVGFFVAAFAGGPAVPGKGREGDATAASRCRPNQPMLIRKGKVMELVAKLLRLLQGNSIRPRRQSRQTRAARPRQPVLPRLEALESRLTPTLSAVADTTAYPFRAVVDLEVNFPHGGMHGSGALIDRFHVLTAGHMLYNYSLGGFATNIVVTPGESGNVAPFGTAKMVWERVTPRWEAASANHPNQTWQGDDDFGLITLDKAVGDLTGWYGMYYQNTNDPIQLNQIYSGLALNTAGYPGYGVKLNNGQTAPGSEMFHDYGPTAGVSSDGTLVRYPSIETHPGQSGSPVWYYDGKNVSSTGIMAVEVSYGVGTRITQAMYNTIHDAMNYDVTNHPPQSATPTSNRATTTYSASYAAQVNLSATWTPTGNNAVLDPAVPAAAATTTAFGEAPTSVQAGDHQWLNVTVTPSGSGSLTGNVTFYDGNTLLGTVPLRSTLWVYYADWDTSTLSVGSHTITAVYSGDSNFQGSSAALTISVTPAPQPPPANLTKVAGALAHSAEYLGYVVTAAYQHYLYRTPGSAEVAGWVGAMQGGLSDERLEAAFIGSAEYIAGHGGSGAGWVFGMYRDLLGRTPAQAEVDGWVAALNGGMTPQAVAYGFAASEEREGQRVAADYQKYLGRGATAPEIAGWVSAFEQGYSNEDVIAGFVGSVEYYQNHGSTPSTWLDAAFRDILGRPADAAADNSWLPVLQS